MTQEPLRRCSVIGLSVCIAVAMLPAWTVLNSARNLESSYEVRIRSGLHRALGNEGRCLVEEPSGMECPGLSLSAGTLADTLLVSAGGRGAETVLRVESAEEGGELALQASVLHAPWVVCQGIFDAATGDGRYRCSTDQLVERAASLRNLVLPVAVVSVMLAGFLMARWRASRLARGIGFVLAGVALALFVVSGGPQLIPEFPGYGRTLGDSVWTRGMLLK